MSKKTLKIKFHGRILDHLGIQMYQSPVAAIAELISNAWDAEAESVKISIPNADNKINHILVEDDGIGMTLDDCEKRYLNIGYCRRGKDNSIVKSPSKKRPILGRKGIGKFAGFGIARTIEVTTISKETGELTKFLLDLDQLRTGEYVAEGGTIDVIEHLEPDEERRSKHGTQLKLKDLVLKRQIRRDFPKSMARRFILLQHAHDFIVTINEEKLPQDGDLPGIEYSFPSDYDENDEGAKNLHTDRDGWALEEIEGYKIKWKINFYKDPIEVEELRGISIFANGKLAQKAFFFNLTGGLGGQHGQEYMSGQVIADYIDQMDFDIISPERQRINWEDENSIPLEAWGQGKVKELLKKWQAKRGKKRQEQIESKVDGFSDRLGKFQPRERNVVKTTLMKLGSISTLSDEQFETLGKSVLRSWEQGRLKELITDLSEVEEMDEQSLVEILTEQDILTALNVAEAVKTKKQTIDGLERRVKDKELENPVRDYIAENPWLVHPKYQTYKIESSLKSIFDPFAIKHNISDGYEKKRVDLILESGNQLIVLEFMRPGKSLDWDHLARYEIYFREIVAHVRSNSSLNYNSVEGIIIADNLNKDVAFNDKLQALVRDNMYAYDWQTLLARAGSEWGEFFDALIERTPRDARMAQLLDPPKES
ncbi:MAG: ATP-binding protein [Verrucomicrobiota bacterium]